MDAPGRIVALVVAAGSGSRVGGGVLPKQYRRLAGKAVLAHAVAHLRHPRIDEIKVVIGTGHEAFYREAIGALALPHPVIGGETRRLSVRNGLAAVAAEGGASQVLIHDAARPFLPPPVIDRLLGALESHGGAVPVLPVVDTLAAADGRLGHSVPREGLVRVQTPQAFRFAEIFEAHESWNGPEPTDDAQMARAAGSAVATVDGDSMLEKLTYESDFVRAEARLGARMTSRTGLGFDVHAFGPGDGVWLGGVHVPHDRGLIGHSDADVLLHALTDALLGAIGAGDIGDHFPPSDPQWRGAPSALFLERARDLVERAGGRIDHVDGTIVSEAPRVGPYREAMRRRIADLLRLPLGSVSVKATTTERLGFTGRGEGMAAQAVATISLPEAS
ncbi:bifunctional 2-C-methyl-D-erythritol 4-phosphate cytidylyltransferase/2-C-methyl-D-erythritol 2,4-cyclodiphosphate synthase [Sphingosinicella sp. CPCC 101087]|uniref:bifunctional 2-C-methyl-D-erythritol 4-phosphate cytidylyltransferase/2-C-methyl-D-erythritol 2,4-cyclodiphosphate synthase n=1 Tax=Sphingosinicella sp. CPCC 101087 TaxID=2497754 RepID=UPI00101B5DA1|nr:bifunctional 2-C-methyl-D-erythritol 4-phosphate cytidylyltransferase/2-C-methyl-D-erythritol 2,4-cyclodiphosphate synthase [Sphingosinicella sp. CPCC 101087]